MFINKCKAYAWIDPLLIQVGIRVNSTVINIGKVIALILISGILRTILRPVIQIFASKLLEIRNYCWQIKLQITTHFVIISSNCDFLQSNPLNYSETGTLKLTIVRKPLKCVHTVAVASFYSCMCTEPLTPPTWQINFLNATLCLCLNYIIFVQPCIIACSMQHGPLTPLIYPGSCKTCFFCTPGFGRKSFLLCPIIDLTVDLKLICIFGLSDLVNFRHLRHYKLH